MKQVNKYRHFRALLLAALLSAVVVSCSKGDREPQPTTGDAVIRLSAQIASTPESKGVSLTSEVQTGLVFLRTDNARAEVPTDFSRAASFTADRAADGTLSNYSIPQLYNLNDNYAYFVGYHPAGTITSNTTAWTLADGGKADILLTETVWGAGRYSAPVTSGMTFDHQLARLQVVCTADASDELSVVQSVWGEITKIEILNTATTATYDHATLKMGFLGSTTLQLSAADCQTDLANITLAKNTTTPCAGGMFAPLTATTPIILKVYTTTVTSGTEVDIQLKSGGTNRAFAKGMTHKVTLTFGANDKNIAVSTTSVEDWVVGGTGAMDDITSVPVREPSEGILDMRYPALIKSGSMNGTQANLTSTTTSYNSYTYNASNADNNGGYKSTVALAFAEPVYYKLEVAPAEETVAVGTSGWDATGTKATWTTAWDACKAKAPAGQWRLPRASELALMYLNKTELATTPGFIAFASVVYWSSAEFTTGTSWYVTFYNGGTIYDNKTTTFRARCVREL